MTNPFVVLSKEKRPYKGRYPFEQMGTLLPFTAAGGEKQKTIPKRAHNYFFLLAMVRLGPLRVLALVFERWPLTGRPLRCRSPR